MQQIHMSLGALRKLSEVWTMAETMSKKVKDLASAVLGSSRNSACLANTESTGPALQRLEPARFDDISTFNHSDHTQAEDDAWFEKFLGEQVLG